MLSAVALRGPYPRGSLSATPAFGQRRAIALNVIVFFFFALTALVFLTRAAVAANAINRDVASAIEPETVGINQSTSKVDALDKTVALTRQIQAAAKPLSGYLAGVVASTNTIKGNAALTNDEVLTIGQSVAGIKASTGAINPAIGVLGRNVAAIHNQVGDVAARYKTVAAQTTSMVSNLSGTNSSLAYVLSATHPLNGSVDNISSTIQLINGRTHRIADSPILLRNGLQLTGLLGDVLGGT